MCERSKKLISVHVTLLYNIIIPESITEITMYVVITYIGRIYIWIVWKKNMKMLDERYNPDTLRKSKINNIIMYVSEKHIS